MHVVGESVDDLVKDAKAKVSDGFTAIRFSPYKSDFYMHKSFSGWAEESVNRVAAIRESIGNDIDICIEIHRQMSPAESISLGKRLEPFFPFFYEDPMLPDSPAIMSEIQAQCNIPIATGERFTSIYEFQQLLEAKSTSYIRPDLCLASGISGCKKISAMAEAHHIKVIPHNPLSPISTAACVQLDASIPNFALQEYTGESEPPKKDLIEKPIKLESGYLIVPEASGLGITLSEDALKMPENPKILDTPIGFDGSVQDR
jgi:galactonate dehydratase